MYLLTLFPLFINIILVFLFGQFLGKKGVIILTVLNLIISNSINIFAIYETIFCGFSTSLKIFSWVNISYFYVDWGFTYDEVSVIMSCVVLFISLIVHVFTIEYMNSDPYFIRFFMYLTIFTFFMLVFVISDNFLQMFLGWEGVGLTSYLLINFWYTRLEANKAAIKAIIVNRFGDVSIYLALILIFFSFQTFDYSTVFATSYYLSNELIYLPFYTHLNLLITTKIGLISFFILVGAATKSAQFGFHSWLPDAMEGPTPVSALLHAATMVTAGVYIIIRISPLIEFSPVILWMISILGGLTALFSAFVGIFQFDIKKVIAYSTCSQLGYMFAICGFSGYSIALFHLFNHAFFKALLFLGAGSVIHSLTDEQDMRKMGSLHSFLPFTYISLFVASLSLAGVPFLSGFFSKDIILEFLYADMSFTGLFVFFLTILAACCTAFYSMRLLYLVFIRRFGGYSISLVNVHELPNYILILFGSLIFLSIFSGFLFSEVCSSVAPLIWNNSLLIALNNVVFVEFEYISYLIRLLPLLFSCCTLLIAFYIYYYYLQVSQLINYIFLNNIIFSFFYFKWYFDYIYRYLVLFFFYFTYYGFYKLIDRGFVEYFGTLSIAWFINYFVFIFSKLLNGILSLYVFIMFVNFIIIWLILSQFGLLFIFYPVNFIVVSMFLTVLICFFYLFIILNRGIKNL